MTSRVHTLTEWVIAESDDGDWGGDYGGGYGGDAGGASLYSTFIRPFTDVLDTAKYTVETGMSKVQLLTGIATYGVMTMFMPFVKANFQAMVEHDKRRMNAIHQRYADVMRRTQQALSETGGNYDGAGIFFVLFPDAVIAKNLTKNAAGAGKNTTKMAVDTAFDFLDAVTLNATSVVTDPLRRRLGFTENVSTRRLVEDDKQDAPPREIVLARKLMAHPKIKRAVANSKTIKGMRSAGLKALMGTISDAVEPVKKLADVHDVSSAERVTGKHFDVASALRDKKVDPSTVKRQELDSVVADVVPHVVTSAVKPFAERLLKLRSNMEKLAAEYGVTDTETYASMKKLLDEGIAQLDDIV